MQTFRIQVRYIVDNNQLGRYGWLIGKGPDLAIGNIYINERNATEYNVKDLEYILRQPAIGKKFVVVKIADVNHK